MTVLLISAYLKLALLSTNLIGLSPRVFTPAVLRTHDIISAIDRAQEDREQRLTGYAATEYYTVRNSHFAQPATLTATVTYRKGQGKTYTVLARTGPSFLQERVINRILKEDADLSRGPQRAHNLLTSANYAMQVEGAESLHGTLCYVVTLHPRSHNFSLIEGRAWIDAKRFALLRIEGKPASNPSFWTGRPTIQRDYAIIDGFSFPHHSRATSKAFFAGKSELTIDYRQYLLFKREQ